MIRAAALVGHAWGRVAIDRMKKPGIVEELTGLKRNRVFAYGPYVELLREGTEPIR